MIRAYARLAALAAFILYGTAWAEEADTTERNVLGGSPPIYAGQPQPPLVTSAYKRFRIVPQDVQPSTATPDGEHCATRVGLFGPGPQRPVGSNCIGRDVVGQLFRGRVVPKGSGRFCETAAGTFGPGNEQPIGMPCSGETRNGPVQGRIIAAD